MVSVSRETYVWLYGANVFDQPVKDMVGFHTFDGDGGQWVTLFYERACKKVEVQNCES